MMIVGHLIYIYLDWFAFFAFIHVHPRISFNLTPMNFFYCRRNPAPTAPAASTTNGANNETSQNQVDLVKSMTPEERKEYVTNFLKTQVCATLSSRIDLIRYVRDAYWCTKRIFFYFFISFRNLLTTKIIVTSRPLHPTVFEWRNLLHFIWIPNMISNRTCPVQMQALNLIIWHRQRLFQAVLYAWIDLKMAKIYVAHRIKSVHTNFIWNVYSHGYWNHKIAPVVVVII